MDETRENQVKPKEVSEIVTGIGEEQDQMILDQIGQNLLDLNDAEKLFSELRNERDEDLDLKIREGLLRDIVLDGLRHAVAEARKFYDVECYVLEKDRREKLWAAVEVGLGLLLAALAIALGQWYLRLLALGGYFLLSLLFAQRTKMTV